MAKILVANRGEMAVRVIRTCAVSMEILDQRRPGMRRAAGKLTVERRRSLSSRLPGRVVRIARKPGEAVREGERVLEVLVREGQAVEGGAALATAE